MKRCLILIALFLCGCAYRPVPVFCDFCWYDGPVDVRADVDVHGEECPRCSVGQLLDMTGVE